ncbi:hypothetical protein ACFW1A_14400 [Kitasatospora sp. NPDC058965]|uniref:hypothetical protein n=1 Tax=Kitasatospora sp. NPDC058965 TaxID=3346682 RepID=UPI0036C04847
MTAAAVRWYVNTAGVPRDSGYRWYPLEPGVDPAPAQAALHTPVAGCAPDRLVSDEDPSLLLARAADGRWLLFVGGLVPPRVPVGRHRRIGALLLGIAPPGGSPLPLLAVARLALADGAGAEVAAALPLHWEEGRPVVLTGRQWPPQERLPDGAGPAGGGAAAGGAAAVGGAVGGVPAGGDGAVGGGPAGGGSAGGGPAGGGAAPDWDACVAEPDTAAGRAAVRAALAALRPGDLAGLRQERALLLRGSALEAGELAELQPWRAVAAKLTRTLSRRRVHEPVPHPKERQRGRTADPGGARRGRRALAVATAALVTAATAVGLVLAARPSGHGTRTGTTPGASTGARPPTGQAVSPPVVAPWTPVLPTGSVTLLTAPPLPGASPWNGPVPTGAAPSPTRTPPAPTVGAVGGALPGTG